MLLRVIIPKTKKFGCVGRGDLTFLFKSCGIHESRGRPIAEWKITRVLRVDRQACKNYALVLELVVCTFKFKNSKFIYKMYL